MTILKVRKKNPKGSKTMLNKLILYKIYLDKKNCKIFKIN